jgi:hypothetical protein
MGRMIAPEWFRSVCRVLFPVLYPVVTVAGCSVAIVLWVACALLYGLLRGPWYLLRIADKERANDVWVLWAAVRDYGPAWRIGWVMHKKEW